MVAGDEHKEPEGGGLDSGTAFPDIPEQGFFLMYNKDLLTTSCSFPDTIPYDICPILLNLK